MTFIPTLLRTFYPLMSGLGLIANSKFFKQLDGNPNEDIEVRSGCFNLVVPQNDYVGRSIKYFGDLDKKVTWVVKRVLRPGDTALDIGANLGLVSFKMLECVGASGKVIAFEPQSRMIRYIKESIARNAVHNLQLEKSALGDKPDTLRLSIPDHNAGAASLATDVGPHSEDVPVTTLDIFAKEHDLSGVRLLKIDVEGFEPRVFAGGERFLTTVKPDVILFEENRRSGITPESVRIIISYGYEVYSLPKAWFSVILRPYQIDAKAHDFVAIHQDAPAALRSRLGI